MKETKYFIKSHLDEIFRDMLGDEFIKSAVIDLAQVNHIQVFVKTVNEFIWGDRFLDDPAYDYLENLGYTDINIDAAKEIKGGLWYGYED